jgi:hypothetical protein
VVVVIFILIPREVLFPNHGYKAKAKLEAVIGFKDFGGPTNSPLGAEI